MRTTAATAAVVGALALSVLAAPSAQADGRYGDITITKVTVNGGENVVVGTSAVKKFSVTVTAKDDSGIEAADIDLRGPAFGYLSSSDTRCSGNTCTAKFTVDPKVDLLYSNDVAGTWYVGAWVDANDGDFISTEKAKSFKFQRASRLSANASPEPVKKGKTLQEEGGQELHDGEDRQDQLHRHPEDHRQGLGRRPLALQLRRYVDHPGRLGRR